MANRLLVPLDGSAEAAAVLCALDLWAAGARACPNPALPAGRGAVASHLAAACRRQVRLERDLGRPVDAMLDRVVAPTRGLTVRLEPCDCGLIIPLPLDRAHWRAV